METSESVPATLPERVGTAGIDIFKIAGKSISGWVPSRRTGDPDRIKMPFASKVEQRLSVYLEYHPHVRTYQRGDVSKAFAEAYNLATPLETPYKIKYVYDGTEHEYLPDYIGTLVDGKLLIAEAGLKDQKSTGKPLAKAEVARNKVKELAILEQLPELVDPIIGQIEGNAAKLYHDQKRYIEAEPLYAKAFARWKQHQLKDRKWATFMKNIADFYYEQGRYAESEQLYQQALSICEQVLGPEVPDVANILENYVSLLRKTRRESEAEGFEIRVKAIRAKTQD